MKFLQRSFFLLASFSLSSFLLAQGSLTFEKEIHDFGQIEEEGGYAEYTFNFVNNGDKPVRITNVKASCGCTTPGWSKEEVPAGESGFVQVRYNPRNRPGNFKKSLRISSNAAAANQTLYITGYVKPKPKSLLEELPVSTGDLRMKYRSLNFARITTEKTVEKEFSVYNAGKDSLSLQYQVMEVPEHIKVSLKPEVLGPSEKGVMLVSYDPIKKNDLGFISDNLSIHVDTTMKEKNEFYVLTTIEEFFPEMSAEELDKAPKLQISERVHDFGKVAEGTMIEAEFTLENAGKTKLNFRQIKSNCSCVTYETKSSNLKKGKSQTLKISFDTSERRGNQYKTVTIFSNDPSAPTQMVTIKGNVQKKD